MGHFGKTITASDMAMDMAHDFMDFFGIKPNDEEDMDDDPYYMTPHTELLTKEMIDPRIDELFDWMKERDLDVDQAQVIAYELLLRGVNIDDSKIDFFISCFMKDEWATQDAERLTYMNMAIDALENYKTDKTPVDIEFHFNFENYFTQKNRDSDIMGIDEIVKVVEDKAGIKIKSRLKDEFSLAFVVSEEDFKKVSPRLYGIKFFTHINS